MTAPLGTSACIVSLSLGVILLSAAGGCSNRDQAALVPVVANPTVALDSDKPCEIPLADEAMLSPREECWLRLIRERCEEDDVCLVDCFANSKHLRRQAETGWVTSIGGGCWHVCASYAGKEWTEPAEWSQCDGLTTER